jgi:uncharacterized caspase-like protein/uncharacterized protein YecT (DUF1311 family)
MRGTAHPVARPLLSVSTLRHMADRGPNSEDINRTRSDRFAAQGPFLFRAPRDMFICRPGMPMRFKHGPTSGLIAALFVFVFWIPLVGNRALAAGFDCAHASLQVDFVICRTEDGRRAIAGLTTAWERVVGTATSDRKAALLDQQRRWIGVYQLICGLSGRGVPPSDPTLRSDKCVVEQLQKRKSTLETILFAYAKTGADSPDAFLMEIYRPYQDSGSTIVLDMNADFYLAPALAKAFQADQARSRQTNTPPNFDGDVLVPSREPLRVSNLEVQTVSLDHTHARGVVSYHISNNSPLTSLTIDLTRLERGWRIASILYPAAEATLAEILAGGSLRAPAPDCAYHPTLSVDTQSAMKAGDWLPIRWSRCAATNRLDSPTFLVIAVPDAVRLRGPGFYALRPHAPAPFGFDFENERVRIIIPLHQPLQPALGTAEIQPVLAGDLPIEAAVFRRERDRNVVVWRSKPMTKTVLPGPISVSVWQEVSSEAPREVRQSNDGRWELRIYKDSYEVIDVRTSDLVIRRAGANLAFSPTQRFLITTTGEGYAEIIDLVARRVIRQHVRDFLVWVHQDSIALENWGRACRVIAIETLVDEGDSGDPRTGDGALACDAWVGSQVDLSIDGGFIANSFQVNDPSVADYEAVSLARLPVEARTFQDWSPPVRNRWMQATFDKSYAGPPQVWRLHDALKIVSTDEPHKIEQSIRPFMMSTSRVVSEQSTVRLASDADRREPITRGLARGGEPAADSLEMSFSKMLGAPVKPLIVAELADVTTQNFNTADYVAPAWIADTNVFGLPAIPLPVTGGSCDHFSTRPPTYIKGGDVVFQASDINGAISQIGYWPGRSTDLAVLSLVSAGTEDGSETTRILRRQADGTWLSDCRHEKAQELYYTKAGYIQVGAHAAEIPPVPFRFPSGEVGLLYTVFHELVLSPASQSEPVCDLHGLREPEALKTLARIGQNLVLLVNNTGDLDLYECPSGRHVISGAILDDELLVYTDEGWFDGSEESAGFVQVRLAGVPGRYPLVQFENALRRPGILKNAVQGKTEPPVSISNPPYVRLGPGGKTVIAADNRFLKALRFYDDGVMVEETAISGHESSVPISSDKLAGARQAAVVALNAADVQSAPLSLASGTAATSRKGRLLGLAVGVDRYNDWRIPELNFAEHDAAVLADALDRYDRANVEASVVSLTGEAATTAATLADIRAKVAEATPADTLVFSFAGHGVVENGNLFLLSFDTDYGDLEKTALNWADIEAAFAASKARIVVFLDACQSGAAALGSGGQHEAAIDRLKSWNGPPILIFAASKGSQSAAETAAAGGGLFTAALVETLRDRAEAGPSAPLLTLNELYASAKRKVIAENPSQIPWFGRRGLFGNFILF